MNIKQLLNEVSDFSSGEKILDSIKDNQAGVSAKKFFGDNNDLSKKLNLRAIDIFGDILEKIERYKLNRTKVIKLILKKADTVNNFINQYENLDPYVAYYKNVEKKEAKGEHKQLFDDFAKSILNKENDKAFEKKVNEIFADKAQVKNKEEEIKQLYGPDKDGWEVFNPLTFAAAKNYSTTKEGTTNWCTAARLDYYNMYTAVGPLYIIRNYEKGIAYQINFKVEKEEKRDYYIEPGRVLVEFMDKNDKRPKEEKDIYNILSRIPEGARKAVETITGKAKDKKPRSLDGFKKDLEKNNSLPAEPFKKITIGNWEKSSFHIDDIKQIKFVIRDNSIKHSSYDEINSFFNKKLKDVGQIDIYKNKKDVKYRGTQYIVANSSDSEIINKVYFDDGDIILLFPTGVPDDLYKIIYKKEKGLEYHKKIEETNKYTIYGNAGKESNYVIKFTPEISIRGDTSLPRNKEGRISGIENIKFVKGNNAIQFTNGKTSVEHQPLYSFEEFFKLIKNFNKEDEKTIIGALLKIIPNLKGALLRDAIDNHSYSKTIGAIYGPDKDTNDKKKTIIDTIKKVKEGLKETGNDNKTNIQ